MAYDKLCDCKWPREPLRNVKDRPPKLTIVEEIHGEMGEATQDSLTMEIMNNADAGETRGRLFCFGQY
jgi:hypothetical protein